MAQFHVRVRDIPMPVEAHHDHPGQEEGQEGQQGWGQPRHVCTQAVGRDTVAGSPVPKLPQDTGGVHTFL